MTTDLSTDQPGDAWFRRFLWQGPRPHGEIWADREVSFLELFYDLVYVVVIARAAHHLAAHVSWQGVFDFVVVFALIWLAWLNGTLYHELHGREDVRSRLAIFAQMMLLAWLGVYTGEATASGGEMFAIVYGILFLLFTVLWFTVWRQDDDQYRPVAQKYIIMMVLSTIVIFASSQLEPETRTLVWLAIVVLTFAAFGLISTSGPGMDGSVTFAMVERFGLFSIIVLGEVVVGVVEGLSEVDEGHPDAKTVAIGLLALTIGFGFWWTYFDFTGRRLPHNTQPGLGIWMTAHLPVTTAIAAAGAAMVDLVAHGTDEETPTATAWLLGGSTAVMFIGVAIIMSRLMAYQRMNAVYRPMMGVMTAAAAGALLIALWRPGPFIFVLALSGLLGATWWVGIMLFRWGLNSGGITLESAAEPTAH